MELVFAEEGCVLCVEADGEGADPDVIADTLMEALAAADARSAQRLIEGAIGHYAHIERR